MSDPFRKGNDVERGLDSSLRKRMKLLSKKLFFYLVIKSYRYAFINTNIIFINCTIHYKL